MLFGIDRDRLGRMLLPVGEYRKSEIRSLPPRSACGWPTRRTARRSVSSPTATTPEFVRRQRAGFRSTIGRDRDHRRACGRAPRRNRSASRSVSARGWASPWANRASWSASKPIRGVWCSARREALARRQLTADRTNWLQTPPPDRSPAKPRSATTRPRPRRPQPCWTGTGWPSSLWSPSSEWPPARPSSATTVPRSWAAGGSNRIISPRLRGCRGTPAEFHQHPAPAA